MTAPKSPTLSVKLEGEYLQALRRRCARLGYPNVSALIRHQAIKEIEYEQAHSEPVSTYTEPGSSTLISAYGFTQD